MMSWVWGIMLLLGIGGCLLQNADLAMTALLDGARSSVEICISLLGAYMLFMGLLNIVEKSGLLNALSKRVRPVIKKLFPGVSEKASGLITLNLTANMLGMGNAATPFGLSAMEELSRINGSSSRASEAMCMLLIVNVSSIQLVPTTIISLRAAAGAASPADITLPALIVTGVSTFIAVAFGLLCAKFFERRRSPWR